LRGLALIYVAALASMAMQIDGLIGENGILPNHSVLATIAQYFPGNNLRLSNGIPS
jgi:lipase maturation factor 1